MDPEVDRVARWVAAGFGRRKDREVQTVLGYAVLRAVAGGKLAHLL